VCVLFGGGLGELGLVVVCLFRLLAVREMVSLFVCNVSPLLMFFLKQGCPLVEERKLVFSYPWTTNEHPLLARSTVPIPGFGFAAVS